ncbi:hypothetical protein GQ43DRAFT_371483 [Delitschia confertaspora ATCC 74209]|uniref:Extracellular membrane protein CFEM domain-containing protein n=1 Tax=Delitschia confertaspora ATCC 74209 TaxID=1513339 RepID=A0A9P4JQI2_9PLEO|nr:hypothetical protein GQ43DRAFT_371483 [Delitschia confertaspora ATCC 74209]
MTTDFCPNDLIGTAIDCVTHTDCKSRGWQATNDCYCRGDMQGAALQYLSDCVSRKCQAGDVAIDASSAGNIYAQYCAQKGYTPSAAPATVHATTTGVGGASRTSTGGAGAAPTNSPSSSNNSSSSSKLSLSAIIGIVFGSLVGLALLTFTLNTLWKCLRQNHPPQKQPFLQQQPPPTYHPEPMGYGLHDMHDYPKYYPMPTSEQELTPDDSFSVAGGMPRAPRTVVSAGGNMGWRQ